MSNEPMTDDEIEYEVYASRDYDDLLRRHLFLRRVFRVLAKERHDLAVKLDGVMNDPLHGGTFDECQGPICRVHRSILSEDVDSAESMRRAINCVVLEQSHQPGQDARVAEQRRWAESGWELPF